jgi:hypothetical protein
LDDEQASLHLGTTRVFTLMDGTAGDSDIGAHTMSSSSKIQKLIRKTCRSMGRNADFYVFTITPKAEQPAEFHIGEELSIEQCDNFRSLIYDDFPESM